MRYVLIALLLTCGCGEVVKEIIEPVETEVRPYGVGGVFIGDSPEEVIAKWGEPTYKTAYAIKGKKEEVWFYNEDDCREVGRLEKTASFTYDSENPNGVVDYVTVR